MPQRSCKISVPGVNIFQFSYSLAATEGQKDTFRLRIPQYVLLQHKQKELKTVSSFCTA